MSGIDALLQLMARLRDPQSGCPWDREQNFASIAPYTIEEAYEVADAIEREAYGELKAELGDLLFQVVFHAQMANEAGLFDFTDVIEGIVDKMTRRHPHVFGDARVEDSQQQTEAWEQMKAQERATQGASSILHDLPISLPALKRAEKIQRRVSKHGFDWSEPAPVLEKVREELTEVEAELANSGAGVEERLEEELGDLLFSCVNLARHLKLDPELALRRANAKFIRRFQAMEQALMADDKSLSEMGSEGLEEAWEKVKAGEEKL